jgi:hypothetical protein
MAEANRRLYQAAYRNELEDNTSDSPPVGQDVDANNTEDTNLSPSEVTWKQRYADLRRHDTSLTQRVRELELQLQASQKKDIKIPSTPQEIETFAKSYPDVFRHIRSIALTELMAEREHISQQTQVVTEDLERLKRERGMQTILKAHPDFDDLNLSEEFHTWARSQPKQIQDWVYEEGDPELCIRGIDLYKAHTAAKAKVTRPSTADVQVRPRGSVDIPLETDGKRIWKASEIQRMHPKAYEQYETEIENARREGRLDLNA